MLHKQLWTCNLLKGLNVISVYHFRSIRLFSKGKPEQVLHYLSLQVVQVACGKDERLCWKQICGLVPFTEYTFEILSRYSPEWQEKGYPSDPVITTFKTAKASKISTVSCQHQTVIVSLLMFLKAPFLRVINPFPHNGTF